MTYFIQHFGTILKRRVGKPYEETCGKTIRRKHPNFSWDLKSHPKLETAENIDYFETHLMVSTYLEYLPTELRKKVFSYVTPVYKCDYFEPDPISDINEGEHLGYGL